MSSKDKKSKDKKDRKRKKDKQAKDKKKKSKGTQAVKYPDHDAASSAMHAEFDEWIASDVETANCDWEKVELEDSMVYFSYCGSDEFTITYPSEYPNTDERFFVYSENDNMDDWCTAMMEFCDKPSKTKPPVSLGNFLTYAAEKYLELVDDEGEGDDDDGLADFELRDEYDEFDMGFETSMAPEKKEKKQKMVEIDENRFLQIGSMSATLRILQDLRNIKSGDTKALNDTKGFDANPVMVKGKNKENLYHWAIHLYFEKDTTIGKDLVRYKSKSGKEYVELEMRFSKDYPHTPPFVRVVRPRFQFRTGHVTVGGSICMELLTLSGWQPTNDIESIVIQIRAEMSGGNARLDGSHSGEYSEHEAWDAFRRAARTHGWNIKTLGPNMFPKIV